jgi:membrane-associated phospholipid phosphatase
MLANAISLLLNGLFVVPLVIAVVLKRIGPALITVEMFFVAASVEYLKPLFDSPRPAGARGCDLLCSGPAVGGKPGFPSGHMATTTAFAASMAFLFPSPLVIGPCVALVLAMGWSRYAKKCHTLSQIIGGTLYGFAIAVLFKGFL